MTCPYCKGTGRQLLLDKYVDCLECDANKEISIPAASVFVDTERLYGPMTVYPGSQIYPILTSNTTHSYVTNKGDSVAYDDLWDDDRVDLSVREWRRLKKRLEDEGFDDQEVYDKIEQIRAKGNDFYVFI